MSKRTRSQTPISSQPKVKNCASGSGDDITVAVHRDEAAEDGRKLRVDSDQIRPVRSAMDDHSYRSRKAKGMTRRGGQTHLSHRVLKLNALLRFPPFQSSISFHNGVDALSKRGRLLPGDLPHAAPGPVI